MSKAERSHLLDQYAALLGTLAALDRQLDGDAHEAERWRDRAARCAPPDDSEVPF